MYPNLPPGPVALFEVLSNPLNLGSSLQMTVFHCVSSSPCSDAKGSLAFLCLIKSNGFFLFCPKLESSLFSSLALALGRGAAVAEEGRVRPAKMASHRVR